MIFLVGSALCGLAQNMAELIAFRALQGLGAGGLIVTTIAVIGDVVPPRERGPLPGLLRRGLRRLDGDRAAARRLLRRQPLVALDLLHQPPDRDRRARRDRRGLPRAGRARPAPDRLARRVAARGRALRADPGHRASAARRTPGARRRSSALDRDRGGAAAAVRPRRVDGRASRSCRSRSSATASSSRRARSASSSASRSSARSSTCRSSSRSSRARARRAPGSSCCR